jgi:hypothetical protein
MANFRKPLLAVVLKLPPMEILFALEVALREMQVEMSISTVPQRWLF